MSCYPNAGLPNPLAATGYDETPDITSSQLKEFADEGLLNVVGGCCGTTPDHIRAVVETLKNLPPRKLPESRSALRVSGLEPFEMSGERAPFLNVGERCNIAGSARFKKSAMLLVEAESDVGWEKRTIAFSKSWSNFCWLESVASRDGLLFASKLYPRFSFSRISLSE